MSFGVAIPVAEAGVLQASKRAWEARADEGVRPYVDLGGYCEPLTRGSSMKVSWPGA